MASTVTDQIKGQATRRDRLPGLFVRELNFTVTKFSSYNTSIRPLVVRTATACKASFKLRIGPFPATQPPPSDDPTLPISHVLNSLKRDWQAIPLESQRERYAN